jgi:tetratricopeptide (TPR) repeat protein
MTVSEINKIIENCHLTSTEEKYFRKITSSTENHYKFFDSKIDQRLEYLVDQTIKTLTERYNIINWKPIVFTRPMQELNAASLSINDKYKLLIFDNKAMNLFSDIATLIEKLVPNDGLEIVPLLSENKDLKENITEIKSKLVIKNYNEFKKAILVFNGWLQDSISVDTELFGVAKQIRDACVLFLIGHECAHLFLGHCPIKTSVKNKTYRNWQQEVDADSLGYELMRDTMVQIHPNIKYKAQFDLGFEIFCQCCSINEPLSQIFGKNEFSNTHPDASSSRLGELREIVKKNTSQIWTEDKIKALQNVNDETLEDENKGNKWLDQIYQLTTPGFISDICNEVFDTYTIELTRELLYWAADLDKYRLNNEKFIEQLKTNIGIVNNNLPDGNITGFAEWESRNFTSAVREFAKVEYKSNFKRVVSILYDYLYERYYSRMISKVGQLPEFDAGMDNLENLNLKQADEYFSKALEIDKDKIIRDKDKIIRFALGLTYSIQGQICLKNKCYEAAEQSFNKDIEISPVAYRKSFEGRGKALYKLKKRNEASQDKAVFKILSLVPSRIERVQEFVNAENRQPYSF